MLRIALSDINYDAGVFGCKLASLGADCGSLQGDGRIAGIASCRQDFGSHRIDERFRRKAADAQVSAWIVTEIVKQESGSQGVLAARLQERCECTRK